MNTTIIVMIIWFTGARSPVVIPGFQTMVACNHAIEKLKAEHDAANAGKSAWTQEPDDSRRCLELPAN